MPETSILALICAIDMIYTLFAVRMGWARETNPLLIPSLENSNAAFLSLKGATFLLPLACLEVVRPLRPTFVPLALRAGVAGYLALYGFGSIALLLR